MEAGGKLQTVYGFCCDLDWVPTVFEDAFPPTTVCSACGLVCSMSAVFPCGHVLCRRCFHKCADGESCRCPLHARAHRKEDVAWSTFSTERLLCCKIRCWNAGNGCTLSGPAHEILEHFKDDCQYYAVTCQRCRRSVAQKDVIDHLVSSNCGHEQPQASPTLEGVGATSLLQSLQSFDEKLTENTRLSLDAIKGIHEEQTLLERNMRAVRSLSREEVDGLLERFESRVRKLCSAHTARVLIPCSRIETITTDLRAASVNDKRYTIKKCRELHESINRTSATEVLDFIKKLDEKFSVVMDASKAVLEKNLKSSVALEWSIGSWSNLKETKIRGERVIIWAENPGLFYGYSILTGAEIVSTEGTLSLRLVFQVCKGFFDQLLPWPLQKDFHFKVLHPSDRDSLEIGNFSTKNTDSEGLQMPRTVQNAVLCARNSISITTLEENGYNLNDQIRVSFQVFP